VKLSWLTPNEIRLARDAFIAAGQAWDEYFATGFEPPPVPQGIAAEDWPHIAEHFARAERVSRVVRERGFEYAKYSFASSRHAVEVATVIAAAAQIDAVTMDLLEALFSCEIDDLVAYGSFLELLIEVGEAGDERDVDRMLQLYERFSAAAVDANCSHPAWPERAAAVIDGLAVLYVRCGRLDEADDLFRQRHREERDNLMVALSASRAFLAAGSVARAIHWLGVGASRAHTLGRSDMEAALLRKQDALRARLS
jgi:hypothetical protein